MEIVWHGTASVEVRSTSGRIIFDPFVPLKGSRVDVKIEDYDGFTDIFVTHGHFDHIVNIPEIVARNPHTHVYCTETPYQTLVKKGVPKDNLKKITYGQIMEVNGFSIKTFHGRHAILPKANPHIVLSILKSPQRSNLPYILRENRLCPENDEAVFYYIEADGKSLSLMGSMNLRDSINYPICADVLVLPYNGWDDNYPHAVEIIERLKPKKILLDHYDDTFPPLTGSLDLSPILQNYEGRIAPMELRRTYAI